MPAIACDDETGMDQPIKDHSIVSSESEEYEGRDSLQGWVKMHRMYANEPVFQDEHLWRLYSWLMFYARHQAGAISVKSGTGKRIFRLQPGQVVTGRKALARALNWAESSVKNRLEKLKNLGVISIEVDSQFSIVTVTNYQDDQFIQPVEVDNQRPTKGQSKDKQRPTKGQSKDKQRTQRKNAENDDNEKNENHDSMERESSGDAAFPPTPEKISFLIDEYIKTRSTDEKTSELSQEIESLKTQAEEIKSRYESLLDEGRIKKKTKEWHDAAGGYHKMLDDAKSKQMFLDLLMQKNELGDVRKQDLAMEFFNYWESRGWKKNGQRINLISEVNKWTQREISEKHKGKAGHGRSRLTAAQQLRNAIDESNLQDRQKRTEVPTHRIF